MSGNTEVECVANQYLAQATFMHHLSSSSSSPGHVLSLTARISPQGACARHVCIGTSHSGVHPRLRHLPPLTSLHYTLRHRVPLLVRLREQGVRKSTPVRANRLVQK